MTKRIVIFIIACIAGLFCNASLSHAQFKEDIYATDPNIKQSSSSDPAEKLFSVKEYIGGLSHKNTLKIGTMFAGSVVLPGTAQIYNKDYWKLPIVYGGIGAFAGTGGYYLNRYSKSKKAYDAWELNQTGPMPEIDLQAKKTGTMLMIGAGLVYWGSLLDGVVSYEADKFPHPGRATLYSALLPGLGQIYNGELYKVPIYWGGMLVSVHFLTTNHTNYIRFKKIHNDATNPDPAISGNVPINGETAKWYRDVYRRYRDYSIVATILVYVLQIIDANVCAYMHDFEVTDDITMNIEPAVVSPYNEYAMHVGSVTNPMNNAVGMKIGIRF